MKIRFKRWRKNWTS